MKLVVGARRVLLVGLVCVALFAPAAARAAEPVVLGSASVQNLTALIAKAAKLADKFVPGTGVQVQGMSAMLTQAPEWAGVDWAKPATVVLFGGKAFGKPDPVPVVILAVADAAQFKNAHPAGGPVQFEIRGNLAVIAENPAGLAAITPQRLELYSAFPKLAASADLYVTAYVSAAVAEYQAEIDQGIKELEMDAAGLGPAGPMAMIGKITKTLGPLTNLAGKQLRRASLTLQLNDESVEMSGRFYSEPDSELGTFLAGQPAQGTDLAKFLPADVVMSVAGKLDIEKAKPLVDAVLKAIAAPLEMKPEDQEKLRSLMFASTQTGEFAMGMAGDPAHQGIQSIQVVRIADAAKFRAASKDAVEWFSQSGFGAMLQGMGMQMTLDYKPNAREYKGVPIGRFTVTMAQAPGAEPNPMMGQAPPQITDLAAIDTLGIATSGNTEGDLINALIDRIQGGGGGGLDAAASYQAVVKAAPQGTNVITTISFNSMLAKFVEQVAKQQPAIGLMVGGLIKADPTETPIACTTQFSGDHVDFTTRIPHQPILALVTRIRLMIQQQQRPVPGPQPKGAEF